MWSFSGILSILNLDIPQDFEKVDRYVKQKIKEEKEEDSDLSSHESDSVAEDDSESSGVED